MNHTNFTIPNEVVLANDVSGLMLSFVGINNLLLCIFYPQPIRYLFVYFVVFLNGPTTVYYHGFGETDVGTIVDKSGNYSLAIVLAIAALYDYSYKNVTRLLTMIPLLLANAAITIYLCVVGDRIQLGPFSLGDIMLIIDIVLAFMLHFLKWKEVQPFAAKGIFIYLMILMLIASIFEPWRHKVFLQFVPMHATWHTLCCIVFFLLWVFTFLRFTYHQPQHVEYDDDDEFLIRIEGEKIPLKQAEGGEHAE